AVLVDGRHQGVVVLVEQRPEGPVEGVVVPVGCLVVHALVVVR
ncbi:MAG: hypothetical protein K0R11_1035, partial [Acidimicrobiales bacterium]|nr:hypothetical protein [Acidimicrobiales bacterium]